MGSSPLTRGALSGSFCMVRVMGLIPAHAGSTSTPTPTPTQLGAHPRSRGEHGSPRMGSVTSLGSSPLTRGAHELASRRSKPTGLIPAHAGSTGYLEYCVGGVGAHPRSRGEHLLV